MTEQKSDRFGGIAVIDRVFLSFRMFLILFQIAPAFPARALTPGIVLLASWMAFGLLAPDMADGQRLALALSAGLTMQLAALLPLMLDRVARHIGPRRAAMALLALGLGLPVMLSWLAEVVACQRLVTVQALLWVLFFLSDVVSRSDRVTRQLWPAADLAAARPALARAMAVLYLSLALLSETMRVVLPLEGWLLYWALLPMASHYLVSALTTTVRLHLDNAR